MTVLQMYEKRPRLWIRNLVAIGVVTILLIWSTTVMGDSSGAGESGAKVAVNILLGIFHPDLSFLFDFSSQGVGYLLLETISIAFLGTIVGFVFAIPFSFLGASNIVPKPIALVFRISVMAIRTIPVFIYGLMFIRVTGPGPFAGLLTMAVSSIGMLSKMFIETIEDLDPHIIESLDAAGCTVFQKIRYGIIPQLAADFGSTLIYRFDMNLRDATVLGLVGAGGMGAPLLFAMSSYRWGQVGSILAGLVILVLAVEYCSNRIRNRLIRGY